MPETPPQEGTPTAPAARKPWGSDEDFDADKAWKLIQDLRSDKARATSRLGELEPLAARAQQLEDASKSTEEKFAERLAAVEKRALDAESRALRLDVAAAKGLSPAQARRLTGDTREAMEADADDLLEAFKPATSTEPDPEGEGEGTPRGASAGTKPAEAPAGGRPTEQLRGGTRPNEEPAVDIRKAVAEIPRGF